MRLTRSIHHLLLLSGALVALSCASGALAAPPGNGASHGGGGRGGSGWDHGRGGGWDHGHRGDWHGHHGGYRRGWGGVGIGIGLGFGAATWPYWGAPRYVAPGPYAYYGPGEWVVAPPVYEEVVPATEPAPAARAPEPIVYPRNGQSAAQTEADRRECNRWATTQPDAMADATIFQRATQACLEGRGYTVR